MSRSRGEWKTKNWQGSNAKKEKGKGGEEDRECDGRTAIRERSEKSGRRMENNSKSQKLETVDINIKLILTLT